MKLAVIGDPVEHSRSPEIHAIFLRDAGIVGTYEAITVRKGELADAVVRLRADGFTGCNVTFPLKEEALVVCDRLTPRAEKAVAVNTLRFGDDVTGSNTDGTGAAAALREQVGALEGKRVLVLGTGPTARAAIAELTDAGTRVSLWARDASKVDALCRRFGATAFAHARRAECVAFSALVPEAEIPPEVVAALADAALVMDANYGERSTLGAKLGREIVDGSRMLTLQAAASFQFWSERG